MRGPSGPSRPSRTGIVNLPSAMSEPAGLPIASVVDTRSNTTSAIWKGSCDGAVAVENHADPVCPRRDGLDDVRVGLGSHRAETGRCADQRGGLLFDHLFVCVQAVVGVEVERQLAGLTFDEFGVCGGEQSNRVETQVGRRSLGRTRHEEVTGENGDGVRPVRIDRRCASSRVRLVDHVVVVEAADMDEFDRHPGLDRAVIGDGSELAGQDGEEWAVPFATCVEQVLSDLRQMVVIRGRGLEKAPLDGCHRRPDLGNRDELLEFRHCRRHPTDRPGLELISLGHAPWGPWRADSSGRG